MNFVLIYHIFREPKLPPWFDIELSHEYVIMYHSFMWCDSYPGRNVIDIMLIVASVRIYRVHLLTVISHTGDNNYVYCNIHSNTYYIFNIGRSGSAD